MVFHFRFVAVRQILISRHHIILARNKRATVKLKLGIRRGAPMLRKNSLPEAFFSAMGFAFMNCIQTLQRMTENVIHA